MESIFDIKPNLLERTLLRKKIADRVFKTTLLPALKKFPKNYAPPNSPLKNILHINTVAGKGGAAKVSHEYLNLNLNRRGYNSKILVNNSYCTNNDFVEILERKNISLHKLLHKYQRSEGLLDFYNIYSLKVPELEVFKNADIVHFHNLHGAYFSPFALPMITAQKPAIWTLHDEQSFTGHCAFSFDCTKWQKDCGNCPDLNFYPKLKKDTTAYLLNMKQKIYDYSDFTLVCPSNWLKERAGKSILAGKDVRVIYNGINEKVFVPTDKLEARQKLGLPQHKKILLFSASGSLDNPQKGGKYLLEVYKKLKNRDDIVFVNLGGSSPEKSCNNWINIPYVSEESQLALYYSSADVFIYTSQAESFGLVIAEAMSCAVPVVAFDNTAIPELIKHKETGYLAKNKDADDFITGINLFLESKELREKAGADARNIVLEKFTLERMIDEYIALYEKICVKS